MVFSKIGRERVSSIRTEIDNLQSTNRNENVSIKVGELANLSASLDELTTSEHVRKEAWTFYFHDDANRIT